MEKIPYLGGLVKGDHLSSKIKSVNPILFINGIPLLNKKNVIVNRAIMENNPDVKKIYFIVFSFILLELLRLSMISPLFLTILIFNWLGKLSKIVSLPV